MGKSPCCRQSGQDYVTISQNEGDNFGPALRLVSLFKLDRHRNFQGLPLLPREDGRQKSKFGFHFCRIGHGLRDLVAKEFAISLSKPVYRHLKRSL